MDDSAPRKQKSTDFYTPPSGKKNALTEQHQYDRSDLQRCTKNMLYSEKNSSKLCAEGAIGNLMNVLHCPQNEVEQFWIFFNYLYTLFYKHWMNHLCQKQY